MGKCTGARSSDWLQQKDINGDIVSSWAIKQSDTELRCNLCTRTINLVSKGFHAVNQHAGCEKHRKKCKDAFGPQQLHITRLTTGSCSSKDENKEIKETNNTQSPVLGPIRLFSIRDSATTAELIWTLKTIASNYSFSSSKDIAQVFQAMAPGVFSDISLSPQKMRYLVTEALAPHFHEEMLADARLSYYTVCYDETTNVEGKKELQVRIRYWSEKTRQIVSSHLASCFLGGADAATIHGKIIDIIQTAQLPLEKLLMVGSDGPNVNKKVFRLFNEDILALRSKGLIDIGTCSIHTVHNAYLRSLKEFGDEASELIVCLHRFFDGWPSRWEQYELIQKKLGLPPNKFLKHSTTRWLTFSKSASRVIEQWEGIIAYFLKHIPQKQENLMSNFSYKVISKLLKFSTMKAQLHLCISCSELFTRFTGTFQRNEPLIHVLQSELMFLLQSLLGRVLKKDALKSVQTASSFDHMTLFQNDNLLPTKDIVCSGELTTQLNQLPEKDSMLFRVQMQKHYIAACKHIIDKTQVFSKTLRSFQCLQFQQKQSLQKTCKNIVTIAKALPFDVPEDALQDEWKILILQQHQEKPKDMRIDHYWQQIFMLKSSHETEMYPNITKVVKASLALSHGNADLERGFSVSGWALTEDRSAMSERMLNSILVIKDALLKFGNSPHNVPITSSLLKRAQNAHKLYKNYLESIKRQAAEEGKRKEEEEKAKKEVEERIKSVACEKKKIADLEASMEERKKEEFDKRETRCLLLAEATQKLSKAIEKKSLSDIRVAHALLESVQKVQGEEEKVKKQVDNMQKTVNKRKSVLITNFFAKQQKK